MHEFEYETKCMGTDLVISLVTDTQETAHRIFVDTETRFHIYEAQFSRFLETSELSQLNRERSLIVSPFFLQTLDTAINLHRLTQGYYNPLLQIERLGYTASFDTLNAKKLHTMSAPYNHSIEDITINRATSTIALTDDQKLDFGGFLKGHLAELEARYIEEHNPTVAGVIVNIGGDLHTRGVDEQGNHFEFSIDNPQNKIPITVLLHNESLATSGTYRRTWTIEGTEIHHILARDGTQNPVGAPLSASVIYPHGAEAEAFTKVLMAAPPEDVPHILPDPLRHLTILQDGTIHNAL